MVVLSASLVSRNGNILLARQYVPFTRARLDWIISTFFQRVGSSDQSTLVEADYLRYIYQPLEQSVYLILTVNKDSNIVKDIQTLHLISRLISDMCHPVTEDSVIQFAFDISFALDEVLPLPNIEETSSLSQIIANLEMDSQNEKIENMITKDKEKEAKQKAREKLKQLEQQRKEAAKKASSASRLQSTYVAPVITEKIATSVDSTGTEPNRSAFPRGGMQLSKKKIVLSEDIVQNFGDARVVDGRSVMATKSKPLNAPISPIPPVEGLIFTIDEKLILNLHKEGGIEHFEVKGDLNVMINDNRYLLPAIQMSLAKSDKIQYKTHPNIDKKLFTEKSILLAKDTSKPYPINQQLSVLKWRFLSAEESDIPLLVNCWPSKNRSGGFDVIVDYQLENPQLELTNIIISVPLSSDGTPRVDCSVGEYVWHRERHLLEWVVPKVSSVYNQSGSMELKVAGTNDSEFYPTKVSFSSHTPYIANQVIRVSLMNAAEEVVPYNTMFSFRTEDYKII